MGIRRLLCCALLLIALPAHAEADNFEFSLFAGAWDYSVGGDIATGGQHVTIDRDSGTKANPQAQVLLHYGWRNRWIPALTAGYVHIGAAGQYLAPASFQFGGIDVVSGNTLLQAGVNFNDYEIDADWRALIWRDDERSILEIQPGLAVKYLSGHAAVIGTTVFGVAGLPLGTRVQQERIAIDQPVPLLHGRVEFIPWKRWRFELSGGYFAYDGSHAGELRLTGNWEFWKDHLCLTAGYQEQLYKVSENSFLLHARLSGPMLGIAAVMGP
jgi:hypothetical protein